MECSSLTSFSIFPLSSRRFWWTFIQAFLLHLLLGIQLARDRPEMLPSMVEVDNLPGSGKVFGDQIPDPFRSIPDDHLLSCSAPTALESFPIDALAELFCSFDGPGVGSGIRIAEGEAFLIPAGLREHTA